MKKIPVIEIYGNGESKETEVSYEDYCRKVNAALKKRGWITEK